MNKRFSLSSIRYVMPGMGEILTHPISYPYINGKKYFFRVYLGIVPQADFAILSLLLSLFQYCSKVRPVSFAFRHTSLIQNRMSLFSPPVAPPPPPTCVCLLCGASGSISTIRSLLLLPQCLSPSLTLSASPAGLLIHPGSSFPSFSI